SPVPTWVAVTVPVPWPLPATAMVNALASARATTSAAAAGEMVSETRAPAAPRAATRLAALVLIFTESSPVPAGTVGLRRAGGRAPNDVGHTSGRFHADVTSVCRMLNDAGPEELPRGLRELL